jgi:hypothetical protein
VALLLEHKSAMPSQLQLRLQLLEYIVAIQHRNYDETHDSTMVVIPNVFNQFDKNWQMDSFRSLFKDLSPEMTEFIPEYKILMTNLPEFPTEMMDAFEKYGELRAGMLAMKYAKNKKFLFQHFEELFVFLERHPNREALRSQMVVYLLSASALDARDLETLLKNIFSPILQKEVQMYGTGFIAAAYKEGEIKARQEEQKAAEKAKLAAEKAKVAAVQLKTRTLMMRSWKAKLPIEVIEMITEVTRVDVEKLIAAFDKGKIYFESKERVSAKKLLEITGLADDEVAILLKILKEK